METQEHLPGKWSNPELLMQSAAKKYNLHMTVERFVSDEYESDKQFIRM